MSTYTCPTCHQQMERDMMLLYKHTDKHIVDAIKEKHPSWITKDGYCKKCFEYYKNQMKKKNLFGLKKTTNASMVNIGIGGVRQRTIMGVVVFLLAIAALSVMVVIKSPNHQRLWLFILFFASMLCLLQAREQICVFLGARGTQMMTAKENPVSDKALAIALKSASIKILLLCLSIATTITAIAYFL